MRIDTKFDVGQKVWRIWQTRVTKRCHTCNNTTEVDDLWKIRGRVPVAIKNLSAHLDHEDKDIYYEFDFRSRERKYSWDEADLFATKPAAQAECDTRNERSK